MPACSQLPFSLLTQLLLHLPPLLLLQQKLRLLPLRKQLTKLRRLRKPLKLKLQKLKLQQLKPLLLRSNSSISFNKKAGASCLFYVLKQLISAAGAPLPIYLSV